MAYEVVLTNRADKMLSPRRHQIPARERELIDAAIDALADDPRPDGAIKMRGTGNTGDWRIAPHRDYRVVYRIEEPHPAEEKEEAFEGRVTVLDVGSREGIYR